MKDEGVKIVDDGFEVAKDTIDQIDKTVKSKKAKVTDDYSDTEDNQNDEESPEPTKKKKVVSHETSEPDEEVSFKKNKVEQESDAEETTSVVRDIVKQTKADHGKTLTDDVYESPKVESVYQKLKHKKVKEPKPIWKEEKEEN